MHTLPPACLPVCLPGYSSQATAHCQLPVCLFAGQAIVPRLLCQGYCTPCHLPSFLPVSCPGYSAQAPEHPASCLPVCLLDRLICPGYCTHCYLPVRCPGYSAQATEHPASCRPSCLLAAQATLPRLLNTMPPACLFVYWTCSSAQATAHPATCLPSCLLARLLCPGYCTPCRLPACPFPGQATLPSKPCRLTACLPACWPGCSAQATLPWLLHTLPPAC